MTWYLTIRSDEDYSQYVATASLVEFLTSLSELQATGPATFRTTSGWPWMQLILAKCGPGSIGYQVRDDIAPPWINIVELVCTDYNVPDWYDRLAGRIAAHLGWSAHEDHAGRQVWPIVQ